MPALRRLCTLAIPANPTVGVHAENGASVSRLTVHFQRFLGNLVTIIARRIISWSAATTGFRAPSVLLSQGRQIYLHFKKPMVRRCTGAIVTKAVVTVVKKKKRPCNSGVRSGECRGYATNSRMPGPTFSYSEAASHHDHPCIFK